ncbi:efflux RND transporter periplasmic adaptor subunit [Rhizobium miluonense]|uniref:Membrane fusion protein, Cu(I)/Ag(I) efflux system n=1 Tax=Rhizobium miluonense TaxID=411945 RepID=A0A1C3U7Q7_9HYPH|nr:efflux RND transporter periplasmic adaptor subunit [Rhizobium miluonense]SCB11514.1 membrane fusion protein, Cu(I)/Ag(I) efflux system [Rhizobium miluonense]
MNLPSRVAATLFLAVLLGGGGYWAGTNNLGSIVGIGPVEKAFATPIAQKAAPAGAIIYYRHPDGLPQFSSVPRDANDGRPFVSVRASEDVSFDDKENASSSTKTTDAALPVPSHKGRILYYRNPMGLPDTSKVPKKDSMGMDYIAVYEGEQANSSTVKVSLGKLQRTGVKTVIAGMAGVGRKVQIPGTIVLDERRVSIISMRTDSFLDDVASVTTGDRIAKGEKLFRFYSKDIATVASEYAASRSSDDAGPALRLRNLGVPQEVIDTISKTRQVPASMTYTSPRDGVVLERVATAGMMAKPGDVLFRIADISNVWVIADVPEYDLASVRIGAPAEVKIRSLPGRTFEGTVDLVYPEVNMQTRTTRVRIELPNPDGVLLANMYADVEIEAGIQGPVVAVPNSAIIDTGDRQVVFVDKSEGRFEPKDVKLGVRGDDLTEIRRGIAAGDKVVVSANFLLDAESNLNSALSAMTEEAKP